MADTRSNQIEEVVVRPDDAPTRNQGYNPARDQFGIREDYTRYREKNFRDPDAQYWDRLLDEAGIPKEWIKQMLSKGYTPQQILELWDTRTPAERSGTINLGPDPYDLSENYPTSDPNDGQPIEEVKVYGKIVKPNIIVKLFPKPVQFLIEAGLFGYELYQALPQDLQDEINENTKQAFADAWTELENELMDSFRQFFQYDSVQDFGTTVLPIPNGKVLRTVRPKSTALEVEFEFPWEAPMRKPRRVPAPRELPDPLKAPNWMPQPEPWPNEFPLELPEITFTVPAPEIVWQPAPRKVSQTMAGPTVKAKVEAVVRINPQNLPMRGNRLRGKKERKGASHAAGMFLRGLYRLINKTYGTVDEWMDIVDIFKENMWFDKDGNLVADWEQIGFDLLMNELQDRAIGKMSGFHKEMIQQNGWWINPQFGKLPGQ